MELFILPFRLHDKTGPLIWLHDKMLLLLIQLISLWYSVIFSRACLIFCFCHMAKLTTKWMDKLEWLSVGMFIYNDEKLCNVDVVSVHWTIFLI